LISPSSLASRASNKRPGKHYFRKDVPRPDTWSHPVHTKVIGHWERFLSTGLSIRLVHSLFVHCRALQTQNIKHWSFMNLQEWNEQSAYLS
jgi:hypothetical protein